MDDLLEELTRVADAGFYSVALFTALALPDICAAMESENGWAKKDKYVAWFDKWIEPKYNSGYIGGPRLSGETCYAYRCGLLHQGRSMHENLGYSRIIFLPPMQYKAHNCLLNDALMIDIPTLVKDISDSIREWMKTVKGAQNFERNYAHFMRRHKYGIPPYIVGVEVYS